MTELTLTVPAEHAGERLDAFVAAQVPQLTRAAVQRLLEEGRLCVNGRREKASCRLRADDQLVLVIPPPVAATPEPQAIPLAVIFEDSDLIVVDKPAGLVVHPGAGTPDGTLVNALLAHCHDLSGIGGELRPGIVHRLDKETSGLLVAAKNDRAHQGLAGQFAAHTIKRQYLALVYGSPREEHGRIQSLIGRHPSERTKMSGQVRRGKTAVTHWRVLARYPGMTLLRLRLETGRTHQIRVHLSEAGYPLVGDQVYGGAGRANDLRDPQLKKLVRELGRQALHARLLGFRHPLSDAWLEFEAPLPADLQQLLDYLEQSVSAD